jgi:hypothetical protein
MGARNTESRRSPTIKRPAWLVPAVIVGVILALAAVILALVTRQQLAPFTAEVAGAPRAALDTARIDHGTLAYSTLVESVFRLRNVGDQLLLILGRPEVELIEGCGPPDAVVSSTTLRPGEEATIRLRFTMSARPQLLFPARLSYFYELTVA